MTKRSTVDIAVALKRQERVLTENRDFIIRHLDADDVIDQLIQARLMGKNAVQRLGILTMSRVDKNRIIFEQLSIVGPDSLKIFCDILKKESRQTFIADQLEKCREASVSKTNMHALGVTNSKFSVQTLKSLNLSYVY